MMEPRGEELNGSLLSVVLVMALNLTYLLGGSWPYSLDGSNLARAFARGANRWIATRFCARPRRERFWLDPIRGITSRCAPCCGSSLCA